MLPHPALKRKIIILFSSEIFVKKISIAECWPNMFHTAHICLFTLLFLFGLGSPSIWEPREGHAPYMSGLIVIPCFILDFSLPWGKADRKTLFNITINSPKAIMLQEKKNKILPRSLNSVWRKLQELLRPSFCTEVHNNAIQFNLVSLRRYWRNHASSDSPGTDGTITFCPMHIGECPETSGKQKYRDISGLRSWRDWWHSWSIK